MEPLAKRPRLSAPGQILGQIQEVYGNAGIVEGGEDPGLELLRKRALAQNKLKSRFEAIFAKYERDFTGIGDEIDLRTGEIVVDNGHLLDMQDEKDADSSYRRRVLTEEQGNVITTVNKESVGANVGDSDGNDEDELALDVPNLYQKASQRQESIYRRQSTHASEQSRKRNRDIQTTSITSKSCPSEAEIMAQFGSRLGPEIFQYISRHQSLEDTSIDPVWRVPRIPHLSFEKTPLLHAEAQVISKGTIGRRLTLPLMAEQPDEIDMWSSPKGSSSIWAPTMPPGRRPKDITGVFKGEVFGWRSVPSPSKSNISKVKRQRNIKVSALSTFDGEDTVRHASKADNVLASNKGSRRGQPIDQTPTAETQSRIVPCEDEQTSLAAESTFSKLKTPQNRQAFTPEEDSLMVEWVQETQRRGHALYGWAHWKTFAETNKQHTFLSWLSRYRRHVYPRGLISQDSDDQAKANSVKGDPRMKESIKLEQDAPISHSPPRSVSKFSLDYGKGTVSKKSFKPDISTNATRLSRFRRPPKRDPSRISWGEAVEMLEDTDPVLRATLLEDSNVPKRYGKSRRKSAPPSVAQPVSDSKPSPLSERTPKLEPSQASKPNSISKPTTASKPKSPSNPLPKPILDSDPSMISSPIPNIGLVSKSRTKSKAGRRASTHKPRAQKPRLSNTKSKAEIRTPTHKPKSEKPRLSDTKSKAEIRTPTHKPKSEKPRLSDTKSKAEIHTTTHKLKSKKPRLSNTKSKAEIRTPTHKPRSQKPRLSNLLVDDDLDELSLELDEFLKIPSTSSLSKPSSAEKLENHVTQLTDEKRDVPSRVARHSGFRTSIDSASNDSLTETPGGSRRICGRSGFRCQRDFCLTCE